MRTIVVGGVVAGLLMAACGEKKAKDEREGEMETMVTFRGKPLEIAQLRSLVEDEAFARVISLDIAKHELGPEGLGAVSASPHAGGLRSLNARATGAGDVGVGALARSGSVRAQDLYLGDNGVTATGIEALAGSEALRAATLLQLDQNPIGDAGAKALAASPQVEGLVELHLSLSKIGDEGARALVASPRLRSLEQLVLQFNPFGPDALSGLLEPSALPALRSLTVSPESLDEASRAALKKARPGLELITAP